MSDRLPALRSQIARATELQSVVRTMKAVAASCISQYEAAVQSLAEYDRTVQLALSVNLRRMEDSVSGVISGSAGALSGNRGPTVVVVFGSDQGLVGRFNEAIAEFLLKVAATLPQPCQVWAVGERIQALLESTPFSPQRRFELPGSVGTVAKLVSQILLEIEAQRLRAPIAGLHLVHNRPDAAALHIPVAQRLLPLDADWVRRMAVVAWPTRYPPEIINEDPSTLLALVREYLFVSIFRSCAESLASENASRLSAMQRAESNISERMEGLNRTFHRMRQDSIDEEMFDVLSGFEALAKSA